jgi:lipoprotein-releasing system permease protein
LNRRRFLSRRGPLPLLLAWRYMLGQRSRILSSTALAALFATALGVAAMVIAMALMTGYSHDLKRRLIGLQGDIVASPLRDDAFAASAGAIERLRLLPGVAEVGRVAYGEGSLQSAAVQEGLALTLRGVDPGFLPRGAAGADLRPDGDGVAGILLGSQLQERLGAQPGEMLRLVVLGLTDRGVKFRYRSLRVAGAFSTGFAEFDASWAILDREVLEAARSGGGIDVLEVKLAPEAPAAAVAEEAEALLGGPWLVQRWEALNADLFAALRLQEALLFFVLGLIVVVSTFNTSSTLVILVRERLPDIGVLSSLGLSPRGLFWIFALYGMGLGVAGIFTGLFAGAGIAFLFDHFRLIRFDPDVAAIYFIDSIPFRLELGDLAAIALFSLAVTLLACSLPARRASRLLPAEVLRSE